jgi:hypothetical protein
MGSNSEFVYIFFASDALIVENWGKNEPMASELLDTSFYFNSPIRIKKEVKKISIKTTIQKEIVEKEKFSTPPTIEILGENNTLLANKLVFARIKIANGDYLPLGFARLRTGIDNKYLIAPVPGNYHSDFMEPVSTEIPYIPLYTNSSGMVSFEDLQFSAAGRAGKN